MLIDGRTRFGATAEYTCDADYIIRPPATKRKCESNGRWSRMEIACDIIECPVPRAPAGAVLPDEMKQGSMAKENLHGNNYGFHQNGFCLQKELGFFTKLSCLEFHKSVHLVTLTASSQAAGCPATTERSAPRSSSPA